MQELTQEELGKIAEALNVLAKYGLLYGGFRRRQRRVVEIRLSKTISVKYEDGSLQYINVRSGKTRRFYVYIPPSEQ
jgi:hypothetical protein